ncbi:hypothetical protein HKBW3S33_00778 [Candidatus Hakubella thermalkaliphila]|uniref:Uncharacterized protein n=1 Tax=Candidatus Hakubella thermalkaliphila TaxID=2754717 RepID=A0A6V8P445_9ACTN|nr:hypothetical protein HKBW3S33_00778 [Candidatus Hakubella thermalkaliphila]
MKKWGRFQSLLGIGLLSHDVSGDIVRLSLLKGFNPS